jgi:ribosomal protein L29
MSDTSIPTSTPSGRAAAPVILDRPGGTLTSSGDVIVDNDLTDAEFEAALESSVQAMEEGRVIEGVVVKVDPDEVLLDIGWKSEGVIPVRELSIKELEVKLRDLKEESFDLRLQKATGQLENAARIRVVRREAARVHTVLTERRNKA